MCEEMPGSAIPSEEGQDEPPENHLNAAEIEEEILAGGRSTYNGVPFEDAVDDLLNSPEDDE